MLGSSAVVVQEKEALNDIFGSDDSDDDLQLDDDESKPKVRLRRPAPQTLCHLASPSRPIDR